MLSARPATALYLNPGPHYVRQQVIASTGTYGNKVFLPGMQAGDDPQKGKQINIANGLEGHYIEMILTGYCGDLA